MAKRMKIASMRHRVHLCSQKDVVVDPQEGLRLEREGVLSMWAKIEAKAASNFTPGGQSQKESRGKRTHIITTRYHPDFDVSAMAWVYEERLKSPPRWFKVIKAGQTEHAGSPFFMFDCRLVERGDQVAQPTHALDPDEFGGASANAGVNM